MITPLFNEIPTPFFRPLCSPLSPIYWATLQNLYELDFEGEPLEITQTIAIEQTALLLEKNPELLSRPDQVQEELQKELLEDDTTDDLLLEGELLTKKFSKQILKRLKNCGWFDYEYREAKKGYVLCFRDYSARLIHTLIQISNQEQVVFEGLAQSIKASLNMQELEEKPGVALYNAQKNTKDFIREMKILSRNIHRYAERAVKEAESSKNLLELQFDIYQKKVVHSSYHRFKTTDNIFKYRSFILSQLESLDTKPELLASATQWIAKNQGLSYADSDEVLQDWISYVRNQMLVAPLLSEDLDRKNARYTATTLQKINYLLNQERDLEGKLVKILRNFIDLPEASLTLMDSPFFCFQVQFFEEESFYIKPKERSPLDVKEIPTVDIPVEIKSLLLETTKKALKSQYSRIKVYELAQKLLAKQGELAVADFPLITKKNFVDLIFLSSHGKDPRAPYELRLSENWRQKEIQKNGYRVRPGEFIWKGQNV